MYPNVRGEMKKRGLTLNFVADVWGVTRPTASQKLTGKYPITLNEAKKLKEAIGTELPLEELFKEAE